MTVYVYGEKFQKAHENVMLESFINSIKAKYEKSQDWVYLIFNSFWGKIEVDCICITKNSFIVIDFKNYSGYLSGTENNTWIMNNGLEIKAGKYTNPFLQLKHNKYEGIDFYLQEKKIPFEDFDYSHIQALVIFNKLTPPIMELSGKNKYWFYISDLENCANLIAKINSAKINLQQEEIEFLIKTLGVNLIKDYQSEITIFSENSVALTKEQELLLEELKDFVENDNLQSFLVFGATNTGKTILQEKLRRYCKQRNIANYLIYPTKRLKVNNTNAYSSLYAHIYNIDSKTGKNVSVKTCTNSLTSIYIIEDAHLLTNDKNILDDFFFEFLRIANNPNPLSQISEEPLSKRKVIFFIDPYQIKKTQSLENDFISGFFFKNNNITYKSRELSQIFNIDDEIKLNNILALITAIKTNNFSNLSLENSEDFCIVNEEEKKVIFQEIVDNFKDCPEKTQYIAYNIDECKMFTKKLRKHLFNKNTPVAIENNEWVEIIYSTNENSIFSEDNYNFVYKKTSISPNPEKKSRKIKLDFQDVANGKLNYHIIPCIIDGKKQQILKEFLIAYSQHVNWNYQVVLNHWKDKNKEIISLVRYGYASTISSLQGFKKDYLYINCKWDNEDKESFFRWLYSTIIIGKKVTLFNYPIFDDEINSDELETVEIFNKQTIFSINAKSQCSSLQLGYGIEFAPISDETNEFNNIVVPDELRYSPDVLFSAGILLKIMEAMPKNYKIISLKNSLKISVGTEYYIIENLDNQECFSLELIYTKKKGKCLSIKQDSVNVNFGFLSELSEKAILLNDYSDEFKNLIKSFIEKISQLSYKLIAIHRIDKNTIKVAIAQSLTFRAEIEINSLQDLIINSISLVYFSNSEVYNDMNKLFRYLSNQA